MNQRATASAELAGERRSDRDNCTPSICSFAALDGEKHRPSRIADTLGTVVIPDHAADLHVLVRDRVMLSIER
jgi:hypothetical protein